MQNVTNLLRSLLRVLKLNTELEDYSLVEESIERGIVFRGTNLWILIFAIVVASVGLNMNSTAVIIGAMLISPLMGPINGIGYSVATYNIDLLKRSLKNFGFAVAASIAASFLYFTLSPVSTAQSELLARTSPTIYDVIIALFGGFAGIVAMCSKQKGNVIPGVAIATALMPPLCTVGYGLATGNPSYFIGAFYLFTINTVFIALASMIVTQVLKFPVQPFITDRFKKMTKYVLWIVIAVTVLPSLYLGYTLVQKERFSERAKLYVENVAVVNENFLLRHDVDAGKRIIRLTYGGNSLNDIDKAAIRKRAHDFGIEQAEIYIEQGLKLNDFATELSERDRLKSELSRLSTVIRSKDSKIDSLERIPDLGKNLYAEASKIFPYIRSASYAKTLIFADTTSRAVSLVRFDVSDSLSAVDREKLRNWAAVRVGDSVVVVFE